MIKHILTTN